MAGILISSSHESWHINGWGWRQLISEAIRISSPEQVKVLEVGLRTSGLSFPHLADRDRSAVARILLEAVDTLVSRYGRSTDRYELRYAEVLQELPTLLLGELTSDSNGGNGPNSP